jgi:hypothetical protein
MFADIPERDESESTFKKTYFTKLGAGFPVKLRILDKKAFRIHKHYIPAQRTSVVCLGEDECPVCERNKKLRGEHPDVTPSAIRGYISRQTRYLVNVMNFTLAKVTEEGKVIFADSKNKFPNVIEATGEVLSEIEAKPIRRIEVLERGPTLFGQLNTTNEQVIDEETEEPVGLWNYNIVISATGEGRKMTTNVVPLANENKKVKFNEEDLYDLESVPLRLYADEITMLLGGTTVKDIFALRSATESDLPGEAASADAEVDAIFKND